MVGRLLPCRGDSAVVVERDALEHIGDEVLQVGRSRATQGFDEAARIRIWRLAVAIGAQVVAERGIQLVFADVVAEGVEDHRALLIPDVGLVLHQHQRWFVADFAGASAQVAVELVLEEAAHLRVSVLVLHHAQRRILGEAFGHHVRALNPSADELVSPPLMRKLMRGYEVGEVDIVRLFEAPDEAHVLGIGHGVGEGLGKLAVAREFENAVLLELIWAVVSSCNSRVRVWRTTASCRDRSCRPACSRSRDSRSATCRA